MKNNMRELIKDLIKETEIDYHVLGLYSNEEFAGRIGAFSRLLGECDKIDNAVDNMIEGSQNVKRLQSDLGYLANLK